MADHKLQETKIKIQALTGDNENLNIALQIKDDDLKVYV